MEINSLSRLTPIQFILKDAKRSKSLIFLPTKFEETETNPTENDLLIRAKL